MTYSLVEKAGRLMEEITCEASARLLNINPKTMWNIDQYRMKKMHPELNYTELNLEKMSADEVHFRTIFGEKSSDQNTIHFVTNLVCTKARKVLSNAMGRGSESLLECLKVFAKEQLDQVRYFAVVMHDAFISVIGRKCKNARICVDRFHLAEGVNRVFDEVRKAEFRKAKKNEDEFLTKVLAPHKRYILVERRKNLSNKDHVNLERLLDINKNIFSASVLVEYFHTVLDKTSIKDFRANLKVWYQYVRQTKLKPFLKFASTIRKYRHYIESGVVAR